MYSLRYLCFQLLSILPIVVSAANIGKSQFSSFVDNVGSSNFYAFYDFLKVYHLLVKSAERGDHLEGFIAASRVQLEAYLLAGHTHWAHRICETGFNGGHSALALMFGSMGSKMSSFDFMDKSFQPLAMQLMKQLFGSDRITFIAGNTKTTLQNLTAMHLCNIISIDGGHSYDDSSSDIMNFFHHSACNNIILMDDIFQKALVKW